MGVVLGEGEVKKQSMKRNLARRNDSRANRARGGLLTSLRLVRVLFQGLGNEREREKRDMRKSESDSKKTKLPVAAVVLFVGSGH